MGASLSRPASFFTKDLDLIMDNENWEIPRSAGAKRCSKMRRVRFHLRTRSEGISKGFTKPSLKKNRVNPRASTTVVAGIINNMVKLWHYLPTKKWNGQVAADTYKGPIAKALRKNRGAKQKYVVLEDNDPTGYKSKKAMAAKEEMKIEAIDFPKYSPDLNPCDFFLWSEVQRRMALKKEPRHETVAGYKARLRRTALAIPEAVIRKAVLSIRKRAQQVFDADGGDIPRD